jgi:hypothetical protein
MPLPLTRNQRALLVAYRKYRGQEGPTISQLLGWESLCYLAGIVLIGVGALLVETPWFTALFLGWGAGALYVKILNARRIRKAWPTIAEIVDWERVDRLLGNPGEDQLPLPE